MTPTGSRLRCDAPKKIHSLVYASRQFQAVVRQHARRCAHTGSELRTTRFLGAIDLAGVVHTARISHWWEYSGGLRNVGSYWMTFGQVCCRTTYSHGESR